MRFRRNPETAEALFRHRYLTTVLPLRSSRGLFQAAPQLAVKSWGKASGLALTGTGSDAGCGGDREARVCDARRAACSIWAAAERARLKRTNAPDWVGAFVR